MNRLLIAVAAAALFTAPASAQFESMKLANELGSVLAAEEFCGFEYDQDAIAAFIEEKVDADDMGFAGSLNMQVMGLDMMQNEMSKSQKTAHCAQTKRVAGSYGFMAPS